MDSPGFRPNYVDRRSLDTLDTCLSYKSMIGRISTFHISSTLGDVAKRNCTPREGGRSELIMGGLQSKEMPRGILKKSASADEASIRLLRASIFFTSNTISRHHSESNLTIDIPLINEHSAQATELSSPKSPQKNVTFADDNNLSLVEVRNFIPSNDRLDVWAHSPIFCNSSIHCIGRGGKDVANGAKIFKKPVELLICFKEPCNAADFHERFNHQCVALERCGTRDRAVTGIILVKNIEFEKHVFVRYTLDHWKTSCDVETNYVPNSNDGVTDRFTFFLSLPKACKEMEFAVRFQTSSEEYWDNNQNRNYKVKDSTAA